jgi:hypothetical protein
MWLYVLIFALALSVYGFLLDNSLFFIKRRKRKIELTLRKLSASGADLLENKSGNRFMKEFDEFFVSLFLIFLIANFLPIHYYADGDDGCS